MKAKIAGAALAAVVACAGWVGGIERASAGSISFYGYGFSLEHGTFDTEATFDTGGGLGSFSINQKDEDSDPYYTDVYGVGGTGNSVITDLRRSILGEYVTISFSLKIKSSDAVFSFYQLPGPSDTPDPTFYRGPFDYSLIISQMFFRGDVISTDAVFNSPLASQVGFSFAQLSGDSLPSLVPVPSAAPLFGAALVALGGFGYAKRRAAKVAVV